ncbi:MAG: PhoR: predicted phosphate regulon sensor protein [Verrucomicrobiota bacterium]
MLAAPAAFIYFRVIKPWRAVRRDLERVAGGDYHLPPLSPDYAPYLESATQIRKISRQLEQLDRQIANEGLSLRGILSGMREGILVANRAMRVTLCNKALIGFFPDIKNPVNRTVLEVLRRHEIQQAMESTMDTGRERELELTFDTRTFVVHVAPLAAENETQPRAALIVFQDITAVRSLEAVRREFVANVSHEFRTPLTIINGYIETLRDGAIEDPAMTEKSLEAIHRNVQRLALLLEDLLTISSMENRSRLLHFAKTDLRPLVERVIENLGPKIEERSAEIVLDWAEDAQCAEIDPSGIEQVCTNLLLNALQHGEVPALKIHLTAKRVGENIQLTFSDNGPGIPLEDQAHIFERFYRVHKHRARDAGGTGLGLSIVKNIVLAHGGTVSLESTPGEGAAFHVTLPVTQSGKPS